MFSRPTKMDGVVAEALLAMGGTATEGALMRYIAGHYIVNSLTMVNEVRAGLKAGVADGRWVKTGATYSCQPR